MEGLWLLENSVHTGCALYVALPQAAFPGHRAMAAEGRSQGEPPSQPPHSAATRKRAESATLEGGDS